MQIPLLDLTSQYKSIKSEIDEAIEQVLNNGTFILGENVRRLEEEIAHFIGTGFGIGVASGTDALELSLTALGIGEGDEVITTPFTFIATAEAICAVGAKPVFIDIDLDTYNIDPQKVREYLRKAQSAKRRAIKALIPVHLYGQTCLMDELCEITKEYKIKMVEDCAQAIGAECRGKKVGSFGDCAGFSFFPSKNLGAYGDGGMVLTNNPEVAATLKMLRAHGSSKKYFHKIKGRNSRLDELQAAILRVKLKKISGWNQARIKYANLYNTLFSKQELEKEIILPKSQGDRLHIYHLYCIRVKNRDKLKEFLAANGVSCAIHYPLGIHLQEVYKNLGYKNGDLPNSELASSQILALPLYPEMSIEQIEYVVDKINSFYSKGA
ncbi:MAG: DegT/DnrJ/EryC1/StrS family aminotransferase [Candidatus Omnitrophota bacterium]|nr:DegT/DnrJ/EryC1/StrS family aminotransferase [Candidatus Omnitrophota bacterium]